MDIATISIDQLQHDNISDPITECTSISQASKTETLLRSDFGAVVCSTNTAGSTLDPDGDFDSV
ncbi:hypothetical protein, partial [Klebsiella pneumoniae]|uniref:hypothetical protein n=1 Tax=Klebsiella pneumoniae TaxID=573 RepID=UPI003013579B